MEREMLGSVRLQNCGWRVLIGGGPFRRVGKQETKAGASLMAVTVKSLNEHNENS
jgi:hypothetical protein